MRPMSYDFRSRRSMVVARRGLVSTSSPLAAQAGLAILRAGGNAADAAIATAAVLNVTEPASTGVGGDCFALYFDAKTRQVTALNGSGRAPKALTIDLLRSKRMASIPDNSPHAVTVPGTVAGWNDLLVRHGSMPLKTVLTDAITYARDGYPVGPVFGAAWKRAGSHLRTLPNTEDYVPGGSGPEVGQMVRLPGLAKTLQMIAEGGPEAF